jgi:hypothetical protein
MVYMYNVFDTMVYMYNILDTMVYMYKILDTMVYIYIYKLLENMFICLIYLPDSFTSGKFPVA